MKILIIMGGFFPGKKYGGPPVSVDNFCSLMNQDDCYIVTSNHDMGETKPYHDIPINKWVKRTNCNVLYLPDVDYSKTTFEKIIIDIKPDVLYLQGLFQKCVLPCLALSKKYQLRIILAPRGELCAGAFKKKYKKIPYIEFLKVCGLIKKVHYQSTSDEETEAIHRRLGVSYDKIHYLNNIPSIPLKEYVREVKEAGRAKFVFLSRIHPHKNLIKAIHYFECVTQNVIFDIYGPIEDEKYWIDCNNAIENLPANVIVRYCGLVPHEDVHKVFSEYNAFLLPTQSENYGHAILEALSVGTPVIISNMTPWKNLVCQSSGWDIDLKDNKTFQMAIQYIVDIEGEEYKEMENGAKEYFTKASRLNILRDEYEACLEQI